MDEFPLLGTQDFYIFNTQKIVLKVEIEPVGDEPQFEIKAFAYRFARHETNSLSAWVNNQYSDMYMTNAATPVESTQLPDTLPVITSAVFTQQHAYYDTYDLYNASYRINDFRSDGVTLNGVNIVDFNKLVEVAFKAR